MSTLESLLLSAASAAGSQFWLDVAVKATALLLAASAASVLLRRSSAALRHRVWCLAFAALVLLPALSAALPEWRLEILPRIEEGELASEAAIAATPPVEIAEVAAPLTPPAEPAFFDPPARGEALPDAFARAPSPPPAPAPAVSEQPQSTPAAAWQWPGLATIWLAGAGLALAPLAIGLARMFVLRRQSQAVACAAWTSLVDEVRARLGLARRVALLETRRAVMPMTWGLVRPAVLLPSQAREWSERLRRIVLLHELAHVKRYDVGFQLLGRLTCALYWFHPLAWYALRRLRIERELACDDCVVHSGELASDYAAELLQIARTYQPVRLAAAIAMAQRSSLEHRIRAMFDRACSHLPVSARTARLSLVGAAMLLTTIAAVRLAPRASAEGKESERPSESAAADGESKVAATEAETPDAKPRRSELHGRVVDEAGRPIAGARVRLLHIDIERTTWADQGQIVAASKSGPDGRFAIECPSDKPFVAGEHFSDSSNVVLADAEGRAFHWRQVQPGGGEITLRLLSDDAPIEGRVLDLEGRPIAGVRVSVHEISGGAKDLDQWVEAAKRNPDTLDESMMIQPIGAKNSQPRPSVARYPGTENLQPGLASLLPAATTDEKGSFRLVGLGRDRLVCLELAGGGIAKTWLNVVTRDIPAVPYPSYDPRFRVQTCFGRRFDFTSEPEQPIAGVVRDADSGRPLAGVEVRLNQYADSLLFVEGFLSTVTDEQGRYELRGVSKPHDRERSHRLRFVPHADQPYFRTALELAKRDGFDPVQCDIELKRAVWLRGRVVNTATGKPIQGLVEYYPFLSNQAAAEYANFEPGMHLMEGDRYATDENGGYQIPVLPGRGVAAFIAKDAERYPQGHGVDAIAGLRQESGLGLNIYHLISLDLVTALREINPPPGAAEAVCDFELKSLDVARVKLVDAKGRPLEGAVAQRLAPYRVGGSHQFGWPQEPLLDAAAEIIGPREQSRTVMFLHRERKLAAALLLTPQSAPPDAIVFRPTATLSGRIVDSDRKPVAELGLTVSALPPPGAEPLRGWVRESLYYSHQLAFATTGPDGAFRVEQVPPGVAYVIFARRGAEQATTRIVQPGEQLDLGDVTLEAAKDDEAPQAKAAAAKPELAKVAIAGDAKTANTKSESSQKNGSSPTTLRGRVLDPEGKPLAGAKVFFWAPGEEMSKLEPKVRTAADGGFEFTVDRSKLKWSNLKWINADDPWLAARVVAAADGYGYDWVQAAEPGADGQYVIRLVNDVPIRGRILSLEGRPAAKAKLTISRVELFRENRLDEYIAACKTGCLPFSADRLGLPPPGQPDSVETDAEGRFNFRGVGAERVANLVLEGEGVASTRLTVMTRDSDVILVPGKLAVRTHGARFTYLAEPSRLIRGAVRERGTKTPIAGVEVRARAAAPISAKTDAAGRFELHGYPKAAKYFLDAAAQGSPYFSASLTVADQPGFDPIEVEFELARGIEASGRVTTAAAGKPNPAYVEYCPLYRNPYTDRVGPSFTKPCSSVQCDADGRYTIPVLPGPGILTFQIANLSKGQFGWDSQTYARAWLSRGEIIDFYESAGIKPPEDAIFDNSMPISMGGQALIGIGPSNYNEIALINPADGVTSLTRDIELPLGGTLDVKLVDPDGKPVAEAIARGLTNSAFKIEALNGPEFTLVGLSPRIERQLIVEARERKLAAYKVVRGEQQGPLTLRLEPCGAITGRLLDAAGEPLAETRLGLGRQWYSPEDFAPTTDREGKFRVEGLVPGMPYGISLRSPDGVHHDRPMQDIVVAPGETKDVGDVRLQGPVAVTQPAAVKPAETPKQRMRGQAVGPDQKPVKGARVWLSKPFYDKWTAVAETDEQGAFQFNLETSAVREALAKDAKFAIRLAGTAEGLGFAWTDVGNLNADGGELPAATLRLVEDLAVEGRILKEDGQPAAGVTAHVLHIRQPNEPTLDEYIRAARKDGAGFHTFHDNTWDGNVPGRAAAVTDAEGRFRMTGVGAERLALLSLKGAAIHNWWIVVATRDVPDDEAERKVSGALHLAAAPYDNHYYARFTHVSEPARTLQGIVRDRQTGQPVAGVEVKADFNTSVVATSGADGRFELVGCRKAGSYNLKARATAGSYFLRDVSIADRPGIAPLDCELEMVKGVTARGRVTDRESGQPVGGTVDYYPLFPNPFTSRLGDIAIPCSTSPIDKNGAYELEVLPGPGVIVVRSYDKKYAPARIDVKRVKEILGDVEPWAFGNDEEMLATAAGGQALGIIMRAQFKALAPIKPDDGAATLDQDLALVPGRTIAGVVLGPDGRPLAGVLASGTRAEFGPAYGVYEKLAGAEFAVECVTPDELRTVLFYHPERKLGARLDIAKGYEGTLEVRLQACATATGRLLDAGGKPLREASVVVTHKTSHIHIEDARTWTAKTDGAGAFRVEGLIPGVEYSAAANGKAIFSAKLATGEIRDLGELRLPAAVAAPEKVENKQSTPAAGGKAATMNQAPAQRPAAVEPPGGKEAKKNMAIRGRVLSPDGKPAAGAELYWPHLKRQPPQSPDDLEYAKRAATDEEGRFEVPVSSDDFPLHAAKMPLFAYKPGFGLAWIEVTRSEASRDAALRLVEDRPIRGRVTDTEGRPVAKAHITVNGLMASSGGSLDEFLTAWKQSWNLAFGKLDQTLYAPLGSLVGATTDAAGRFELAGVGIARVARMEVVAPGFASAVLHVVNREGFDPAEYNEAALASGRPQMRAPGMIPRLAGPEFEHIAEAELTIRGKIFVGADRAPVGGATVSASPSWGLSVWAPTDAAGRYELRGLPRNQELLVSFRPPDAANLLNRTLAVSAAPGQAAVDFDVELKRGVIVEGRVFDRATGKGVKSGVRFAPLGGNSFVDQPGYDGYKRSRVMEETDREGRFRLMIIPGPGVLMAQAHGGGPRVAGQEIVPYRQASFTEEERKRVAPTEDGDDRYFTSVDGSLEFLTNENAVKVIDAPPDGGELKVDLPLDPGKLVKIALEDDQGQPLSGAFVAGLTDKWPITFRIAEPGCTIYALGADRPRRICLLHPERRLAASLTLTGEEAQPVTVRLAASAKIAGRAIDDGGAPLADAAVQLYYVRESASELERFASLGRDMIKTDGDGRFELENVVPGERFSLDFKQGDSYFRAILADDQRQLKAEQQLELGDAKVKRLR